MNAVDFKKKYWGFLEDLAAKALDIAHTEKCDAEIEIIKSTGITISTRYGKLENIELHNSNMFSITIYYKYRKGKAISNDFSMTAIKDAVYSAVNIAHYTSVDLYSGITDKNLLPSYSMDLDLFHPIDLNVSLGEKLSSYAEDVALKYDNRITYTDGGRFSGQLVTKIVGNTHGIIQSYNSSQYFLSCGVIAQCNNNMEHGYAYTLNRSFKNLSSSEWVGQECARRTVERLNPQKLKTMRSLILFSAEVAVSLFYHLVDAISGNNVYRKSTFLLNSLGKQIFPSWVSIKEYPHILQGLGSAPFDSEGVKTFNRIIVDQGILYTWLLDNYSSRILKLNNTGHANGPYNWRISCNDFNHHDLIKKMHCGFVITELLGQGVNIINGYYSRGASGFWVENGVIQYPVSEVTISGNLKEMFSDILAIGNNLDTRDQIQCGSVLIKSMTIAGQ